MGGKFAGFLKRVKNVGSKIGSGLKKAGQWLNNNIIQPFKPQIRNLLDTVDPSGVVGNVAEYAADQYDQHLEKTGQKKAPNKKVQQAAKIGSDLINIAKESKYGKAFNPGQELKGGGGW